VAPTVASGVSHQRRCDAVVGSTLHALACLSCRRGVSTYILVCSAVSALQLDVPVEARCDVSGPIRPLPCPGGLRALYVSMAIPLYLPLEHEDGEGERVPSTSAEGGVDAHVTPSISATVSSHPEGTVSSEVSEAVKVSVLRAQCSESVADVASLIPGERAASSGSMNHQTSTSSAGPSRPGRGSGTAASVSASPLATGFSTIAAPFGKRSNSMHELLSEAAAFDAALAPAAAVLSTSSSPSLSPAVLPARGAVLSLNAAASIALPPTGLAHFLQQNSEWPVYASGSTDAPAALATYQPAIDCLSLLSQYAAPHMKLRVVAGEELCRVRITIAF
jgi:hypothetical protein